jgi:hypothetical protein
MILKDKAVDILPADICGKLYSDFDGNELYETIDRETSLWFGVRGHRGLEPSFNTDGKPAGSIWYHCFDGAGKMEASSGDDTGDISIEACSCESVGANLAEHLGRRGCVDFQYQCSEFAIDLTNATFYVVPVDSGGTEVASPTVKRARFEVPRQHVIDRQRHWGCLSFDFSAEASVSYGYFAPRINDDRGDHGPGRMTVHTVRVFPSARP